MKIHIDRAVLEANKRDGTYWAPIILDYTDGRRERAHLVEIFDAKGRTVARVRYDRNCPSPNVWVEVDEESLNAVDPFTYSLDQNGRVIP